MKDPKNILITGGNSGIGEALALLYAEKGKTIAISGRNSERLKKTRKKIEKKGAKVLAKTLSVDKAEPMEKWIKEVDKKAPLDLVIANAGVGIRPGEMPNLDASTKKTFDINVYGVFNTVHPALNIMKKRGRGQIAIISSIAGYMGLPGAPGYSASKNAVRAYGEALRGAFRDKGVEINVVCPGFVKTPLTDKNTFDMPFLVDVDKAAEIIKRRLARNKGRITFPFPMLVLIKFLSILPASWSNAFFSRTPIKE